MYVTVAGAAVTEADAPVESRTPVPRITLALDALGEKAGLLDEAELLMEAVVVDDVAADEAATGAAKGQIGCNEQYREPQTNCYASALASGSERILSSACVGPADPRDCALNIGGVTATNALEIGRVRLRARGGLVHSKSGGVLDDLNGAR